MTHARDAAQIVFVAAVMQNWAGMEPGLTPVLMRPHGLLWVSRGFPLQRCLPLSSCTSLYQFGRPRVKKIALESARRIQYSEFAHGTNDYQTRDIRAPG